MHLETRVLCLALEGLNSPDTARCGLSSPKKNNRNFLLSALVLPTHSKTLGTEYTEGGLRWVAKRQKTDHFTASIV